VKGQAYAACLLLFAFPSGVRTLHYSWWSDDPQPYLRALRQASPSAPPDLAPGETIRAGIVTHHFLASDLMVRFFTTLQAGTSPETLVLLGPNHFHHGLANLSFSSLPWKTPFGILEVDRSAVEQLKGATDLPEDPEAFTGEHSVGVLVPFVKYYFPHVRIVPILVDINAREATLKALHDTLAAWLGNPHMLVVLSMDFSHDSTAGIADSRDKASEEAITYLDASRVERLNVDCRKGLWALLAALRQSGGIKAQVSEHTNSARLTGNLSQPTVTSYFTVYFTRQ
jgi:MEMO1 family protein